MLCFTVCALVQASEKNTCKTQKHKRLCHYLLDFPKWVASYVISWMHCFTSTHTDPGIWKDRCKMNSGAQFKGTLISSQSECKNQPQLTRETYKHHTLNEMYKHHTLNQHSNQSKQLLCEATSQPLSDWQINLTHLTTPLKKTPFRHPLTNIPCVDGDDFNEGIFAYFGQTECSPTRFLPRLLLLAKQSHCVSCSEIAMAAHHMSVFVFFCFSFHSVKYTTSTYISFLIINMSIHFILDWCYPPFSVIIVREHSATVVSARWATTDWAWHKEGK